MSTMKGIMRRAILAGVVGVALTAGAVRADVASDQPGAILIFPKIRVDTLGVLGAPTDTELQVTNTSGSVIAARCFLINQTSHCTNNDTIACTQENEGSSNVALHRCPVGGTCGNPRWLETDFQMILTKRQPIAWQASFGLPVLPCDPRINVPGANACLGGSNTGSSIPGALEDPFFGELRCIEVDPTTFTPSQGLNPANNGAGDLKGEATIVRTTLTPAVAVDAAKYNAIGIQAKPGTNDGNDTLCIGGGTNADCPNGAEYNGCPNILIYNHFFDNAVVTTHTTGAAPVTSSVTSDLTFVPCAADFLVQDNNLASSTLQFLVFNEFEQRFSASTKVTCWRELQLSDIDTRPGDGFPINANAFSIFNVNVQGTLVGQTRIRPVTGPDHGNTVLAVSEEFWTSATGPVQPTLTGTPATVGISTTAENLHFTGVRDLGDIMKLSPGLP